MARPRNSLPSLLTDPRRNRAYCRVGGKFITLGPAGSAEAQAAYGRLIAQLAQNPAETPNSRAVRSGATRGATAVTVNHVCRKFIDVAIPRYVTGTGELSAEERCFRSVLKLLRITFGETPAGEFGPLKARVIRDAMVAKGWSRKFTNKQMVRLRQVFKLAVSYELIPASVLEALRSLPALRPGDIDRPDPPARRAVPLEDVEAVKGRLRQANRDLVDLLTFTSARPSELLGLTTGAIDQSGTVWHARIVQHKNAHRGHERTLYFGPKAQLILRRYLKPDAADDRLFSTSVDTLTKAIRDACKRAKVNRFSAYHLRHTGATLLRDEIGLEAAQAVLGHRHADMTLHYSAAASKAATEAVRKIG
ncbi:MAG TPA: tyrosine-type recombinase/integrase [Planctomycetaceae bacterium]|nr:tyrosine-type recombinase/integrase [Planctomycetaceae bacterium]